MEDEADRLRDLNQKNLINRAKAPQLDEATIQKRSWWALLQWSRDKRSAQCYHDFKGSTSKMFFTISVAIRSLFPIMAPLMIPKAVVILLLVFAVVMVGLSLFRAPYLPQGTNSVTLACMLLFLWCTVCSFGNVWYPEYQDQIYFYMPVGAGAIVIFGYLYGAYIHFLTPNERSEKYRRKQEKEFTRQQTRMKRVHSMHERAKASKRNLDLSKNAIRDRKAADLADMGISE
jgi:hypothetical protein